MGSLLCRHSLLGTGLGAQHPSRLFGKARPGRLADLGTETSCVPPGHNSSLLSESHHMSLMFVLEKVTKLMDEINAADATY